MFRLIEAENYRCLKDVSKRLNPFEVLVGANASGKSTFLDVVSFLSDLLTNGLEYAVETRTGTFHDLVWGRDANAFRLTLQAKLPEDKRSQSAPFLLVDEHRNDNPPRTEFNDQIRYEVCVELDTAERLSIAHESVQLCSSSTDRRELPTVERRPHELIFRDEISLQEYKRDQQHYNFSSLASVPADSRFPATAWLREQLKYAVRSVSLSAADLAKPSPPGTREVAKITGAGLARQVLQLKNDRSSRFRDWVDHIRTVLPDVRKIHSVLDENKRGVLSVEYENGLRIPAHVLSEGTLRLLALTILAYLPDFHGVYLVEEPENGVHPSALEAIFQSLSSTYSAQVLVSSHSPVLLSMAKPEQILCFSKTPEGTRIVRGSEHPALKEWQGEVSLGDMVASGILG